MKTRGYDQIDVLYLETRKPLGLEKKLARIVIIRNLDTENSE